jgi:Copper amine oxidase N-terminal domain
MRYYSAIVAALIAAGSCVTLAVAQSGVPAANFGTPPSGSIPILYNDHHVYTKPDVLKQGRVLAALVKSGTLLIPLRSMFEQMGATVTYNAATKTAIVAKPGAEVRVTVGKPEVTVNGETRPLDVPPIVYQGNVLVPIRVISEGMGAYVLWLADKHLVVVRYLPPTPPPATPPPPPEVTPPPAPPVTPAPAPTQYNDLFVAGDYLISPKVYNEFSPGNSGTGSYAVRGAWEFKALLPWMIEGAFEQFGYPHNCNSPTNTGNVDPQCYVLGIGFGNSYSTFVPAFTARDSNVDVRLGVRIFNPHVYVGVAYLWRSTNYGYPQLKGVGYGIEKLPDLNVPLSFFGSFYGYPEVSNDYTSPSIGTHTLVYSLLDYQIGLDYVIRKSPVFIEAGWMGDQLYARFEAPSNSTANGPFVGLGLKF